MPAKIDVEIKDVEYINGEVILTSNIGDKIARCVIMKVGTHNGIHYNEEALRGFVRDFKKGKLRGSFKVNVNENTDFNQPIHYAKYIR